MIGLIKQPPSAYVDNVGFLFTYEKTTMASLKYHKIRRVERKDVATKETPGGDKKSSNI